MYYLSRWAVFCVPEAEQSWCILCAPDVEQSWCILYAPDVEQSRCILCFIWLSFEYQKWDSPDVVFVSLGCFLCTRSWTQSKLPRCAEFSPCHVSVVPLCVFGQPQQPRSNASSMSEAFEGRTSRQHVESSALQVSLLRWDQWYCPAGISTYFQPHHTKWYRKM